MSSPAATAAAPESGPDHAGVRVPPPLIYLAAFLAGVGLQRAFPLRGLPRRMARLSGLAGVGVWLGLSGWSMLLFRRRRTSIVPVRPATALVTSGPYRFTRNPMYVGLTALYAGLALWRRVMWALVLLPVVIAVIDRYVIAREERYLERRFGEEYRRYRARVRRWL